MSRISKKHRVSVKQEKVILKLLYRKGFAVFGLDPNKWDLTDLFWEWYDDLHPMTYYPIGCYDELGERQFIIDVCDSIEVDMCIDRKAFEYMDSDIDMSKMVRFKSWKSFIKYLRSLPTVKHDSKINKLLKVTL